MRLSSGDSKFNRRGNKASLVDVDGATTGIFPPVSPSEQAMAETLLTPPSPLEVWGAERPQFANS